MDMITLAAARKYVNDTANALGAVKGSPCTIKSITETDDGATVVFSWTGADGVEQTSSTFLPRGPQGLPGEKGEPGAPGKDGSGTVDTVAREQITALTEEMKGNGPHQMLVTGADGSKKWEDRTHWAEDNSKIYNEFSVANGTYNDEDGTFVFSVDNIPLEIDEELGNAFMDGTAGVFIDGVAYNAYPIIGSSNHLHITSMEGDITEEIPFKITVYQNNIETFLTTLPGETHDVKIGIPNVTIHPLDPKYLPEGVGPFVVNVVGTGNGYKNTYTSDRTYEEIKAAYDEGLPVFAFAKIPMSGNQYCCTLLPLDLLDSSFEYDEMTFGGYESNFNKCVLITICKNGDIYDQINSYTLPIPLLADGTMMVVQNKKWVKVDAPVVYSPSGKCFKLTVDDSGNLTATEVTE